ncbi:MAG: C1 family peptidase, partial [Bacteroidota bacterium]
MIKQILLYSLLCLLPALGMAQYEFTPIKTIACTAIKDQGRTGTCWSFSTLSFLESELMRMGEQEADLSEMFLVRTVYKDKAQNYFLRQGKANFSQGSLSHDVIRAYKMGGVVPESAYSGKPKGTRHDHNRMEEDLKRLLDNAMKDPKLRTVWRDSFEHIMNGYIGYVPREFDVADTTYTVEGYTESLPLNPDDYWSFTSFTHHPFYEQFILEIPDNYSNGSYWNVPILALKNIVDEALEKGYTVAWDGDVSEKGFSAKAGIAVLPKVTDQKDIFKVPSTEKEVDQALRQATFEDYSTTDDHLMHLIGTAKDQNGTRYYVVKNSWGEIGTHQGYLYMSEAYFLLKTVGIMVHQESVPNSIREK